MQRFFECESCDKFLKEEDAVTCLRATTFKPKRLRSVFMCPDCWKEFNFPIWEDKKNTTG